GFAVHMLTPSNAIPLGAPATVYVPCTAGVASAARIFLTLLLVPAATQMFAPSNAIAVGLAPTATVFLPVAATVYRSTLLSAVVGDPDVRAVEREGGRLDRRARRAGRGGATRVVAAADCTRARVDARHLARADVGRPHGGAVVGECCRVGVRPQRRRRRCAGD